MLTLTLTLTLNLALALTLTLSERNALLWRPVNYNLAHKNTKKHAIGVLFFICANMVTLVLSATCLVSKLVCQQNVQSPHWYIILTTRPLVYLFFRHSGGHS